MRFSVPAFVRLRSLFYSPGRPPVYAPGAGGPSSVVVSLVSCSGLGLGFGVASGSASGATSGAVLGAVPGASSGVASDAVSVPLLLVSFLNVLFNFLFSLGIRRYQIW